MSAAHSPVGGSLLARLLEHPAIWRGRSAARAEVLPSGCAAFDACLPGGGWPRTGLIEILVSRFGVGELYLLFPALAALTRRPAARWCVWVAPPLEPYAPALSAHGAVLERMLVVRPGGDRAASDRAVSEGIPSGGDRAASRSRSGRLSRRLGPERATSHWRGRPEVRGRVRFGGCSWLPSEGSRLACCFVRCALLGNPPRRFFVSLLSL